MTTDKTPIELSADDSPKVRAKHFFAICGIAMNHNAAAMFPFAEKVMASYRDLDTRPEPKETCLWLEVGIHGRAEEFGGGWIHEVGADDGPHIWFASHDRGMFSYGHDKILEEIGRDLFKGQAWLELCAKLKSEKHFGYAVLKIDVAYEPDWHEENGGVPQLVSAGGWYHTDCEILPSPPKATP